MNNDYCSWTSLVIIYKYHKITNIFRNIIIENFISENITLRKNHDSSEKMKYYNEIIFYDIKHHNIYTISYFYMYI